MRFASFLFFVLNDKERCFAEDLVILKIIAFFQIHDLFPKATMFLNHCINYINPGHVLFNGSLICFKVI